MGGSAPLVLPCRIRPRVPADDPLILDSWCRQVRPAPPHRAGLCSAMSRDEFDAHRASVIIPLIQRCGVLVACEPTHPDQIFGWVCAETQSGRPVLHMVYVRNAWRRQHVATQLFEASWPQWQDRSIIHTHEVKMARADRRGWQALVIAWRLWYNPYAVR